jgi:hypothetical protein
MLNVYSVARLIYLYRIRENSQLRSRDGDFNYTIILCAGRDGRCRQFVSTMSLSTRRQLARCREIGSCQQCRQCQQCRDSDN